MIRSDMMTEAAWTIEIDDNIVIRQNRQVVSTYSKKSLKIVSKKLSLKLKKTIEDMPEVNAKTLKLVVSWE